MQFICDILSVTKLRFGKQNSSSESLKNSDTAFYNILLDAEVSLGKIINTSRNKLFTNLIESRLPLQYKTVTSVNTPGLRDSRRFY